MKWLAIAAVIGTFTACSSSGGGSPTAPSAPPANIAGQFSTTITAASSCSGNVPFPILGFFTTITQTGGTLQLELLGHAPGAPMGNVSGTVSGQTVTFASFPLTEAMGRGATLVASGTGSVATGGLKITGTLNGTFQTPAGLTCNASNHQFEMVKLCSQPTSTGTALLPCAA
ncbi:MAG TPA: hypothetical protein VNT81_08170 [Vicinamibacterales bacterium]|nr:hypothetical protein [Vicinamibacterales bacterium]